PAIEFLRIARRVRAILRYDIDQLGIAAALAVPQTAHGEGGEERNACSVPAIEPVGQKHRLFSDLDELMRGDVYSGAARQCQRNAFPDLDVVVVIFFWEFGDR